MKTRNVFKKVTEAFNQHIKPTTLENEFIPNNGFKQGDELRIWLEDSVEPEGGFWDYGFIDEVGMFRQNDFDYTGKEDELDLVEQYIKWGYKVEKITGEFNKGDKVLVSGCFSDFKHKYDNEWFKGEFIVECSRPSVYKYRVRVNNKVSDWKNIKKDEKL